MPQGGNEAEWLTRKKRIDTRLRAASPPWQIIPWHAGLDTSTLTCHAVTEFPTENGPADYCQHYDSRYGNGLNGPSRTKIEGMVRFMFTIEALEDEGS